MRRPRSRGRHSAAVDLLEQLLGQLDVGEVAPIASEAACTSKVSSSARKPADEQHLVEAGEPQNAADQCPHARDHQGAASREQLLVDAR